MSQDQEPAWQGPDYEVRPDPGAFDTQLGDLVGYCRAITGREEDAVSTAHGVLDSAQSLLNEPDRLRAWLFALARMEILAASAPQNQEIFDLVHRHGIRPEDLPVVLGISPVDADELLAAAEEDVGWDDLAGRDDTTYLNEGRPELPAVESRGEMFERQLPGVVAYCHALTGREEDAVSTAHAVLGSARSLLTQPDRLRAWLFALARREMLGDAAPGAQEILDLVHQHGIRAEGLPIVLGISPIEADELLAAAEEEHASSAFSAGHRDADSRHSEGWHDDRSWDDRAAAWDSSAAWDDGVGWDDGADWDETFGPKSHRLQDIYGLFRKPPESAGRHAAPGFGTAGLRQALARGPVRAAAATGIVVAVMGVSAAFLTASNSPPPKQAAQQTKHRPPAAAQSPATTPSPVLTATPTQRTSQPVTVVLPQAPPAPAPTSPRPSPRPSPKPSKRPSPKPTSSPPSPSSSPPPSSPPPSPTPTLSANPP